MSASSSAIGILKDDANTLQSKKGGGEEDGMGRERGMVGSEAFFASVSPSLKRIRFQEERDERYAGRNTCSASRVSCEIAEFSCL